MEIVNNFVRFSAQGNLPAATVVVGDVPACNSRINIVDTVLFPMLVRVLGSGSGSLLTPHQHANHVLRRAVPAGGKRGRIH